MKHAVLLALCTRLAAPCVLAVVLMGGCTGSETGNPSVSASLSLGLRSTDPSLATVGETGDAIRVRELWLSIAGIAAVPCATGAGEVPINQGPIGDDLVPGFDVGNLPAGEYCGLHVVLAPTALSTLPTGVTTGPATVAVYGTRADDVPFAVLSAAPLDLSIPGAAFTVSEGHSLLLAFDVSSWLRDAVLDSASVMDGLAVLDGREHPSVTATFEAQLTATLHDDLNADGHVDADEAALATIH
jgi:hypothetical protein